jgi:hypothetical protein
LQRPLTAPVSVGAGPEGNDSGKWDRTTKRNFGAGGPGSRRSWMKDRLFPFFF